MKINRYFTEIELTPEEIRKAHEEYLLSTRMQDVKDQIDGGELSLQYDDSNLKAIAERTGDILGKNDAYYDAYWESVNSAINEHFGI